MTSPLQLKAPTPDVFIPDNRTPVEALSRVTHLSVGAHHDDLEFMSLAAIQYCRKTVGAHFGGVVCTDGRGSPRAGSLANLSQDALAEIRIQEQQEAARLGDYSAVIQLGYPSSVVKSPETRTSLVSDLTEIFRMVQPEQLLIHNFADKHPTHIAVAMACLQAVRSLAAGERPRVLIGCEGWRDLGWIPDRKKILLDAGSDTAFAEELYGVFRSQIDGGKRYDRAVLGRKFTNATMLDPHSTDAMEMAEVGMDLTPLLLDDSLDPADLTLALLDEFREEVRTALAATSR